MKFNLNFSKTAKKTSFSLEVDTNNSSSASVAKEPFWDKVCNGLLGLGKTLGIIKYNILPVFD